MELKDNIYSKNIYFAITFDGVSTYILEPDKWNKISERIPRDSEFYGFWSDFLEDKTGMLFTFLQDGDLSGGGQLLKDIYETPGYGANAEVLFSFGNLIGNTPYKINEWRINLNTYNCDFGGVYTSIEKMPFQGKLRSRFSSPCTINGNFTVDGEILTPISTQQLRLHSKTLLERTTSLSVNPDTSIEYFDGGCVAFDCVIQPDQGNLQPNELSEVFSQPFNLVNLGTLSSDGYDADLFKNNISQYNPVDTGLLNVSWSGSYDFYWWEGNFANVNTWTIQPRVSVQRLVAGVWTIVSTHSGTSLTLGSSSTGFSFPFNIATAGFGYLLPTVTDSTNRQNVCRIVGINFSEIFQNVEAESGDCIYVELFLFNTLNGGGPTHGPSDHGLHMMIDKFNNNLTYQQLTVTPSSTCDSFRVFDVLAQMVENITGQKNSVISNFYSKGGAGYKYLLANGYSIRNYGADIYRPKKDLYSLLKDLQAIHCIGVGIRKLGGIEYLVVEYISDFFNNNVILRIKDTFLWKDNQNSQYAYNRVELGYNKYQGLNITQEDEFNTEGKYLLATLKYGDNVLTMKSDTIASGYLIEEQRRNQFLINQQQSLQNDNDMFIIPTSEPNNFQYIGMSFGNSESKVGFYQTSMALQVGDTFQYTVADWIRNYQYVYGSVTNDPGFGFYICINAGGVKSALNPNTDSANWSLGGGLNNLSVFTIVSEVQGYPIIGQDAYNITPAPIDETFVNIPLSITPPSPNQVFAERNQCFEICNNVIDPSTIYGGRISLKHILYNWRPVLGVGLSQVDLNSLDSSVTQIITTLARMNALFTTKFVISEQFKGNVGDLTLVEINRENIKDYLNLGSNIFSQTGAEFKCRLGNSQVNSLRMALSGETGDNTKDGGGIVAKDDFGNYWFCQVMDIQYDLVQEIATFNVQKCYLVSNSSL